MIVATVVASDADRVGATPATSTCCEALRVVVPREIAHKSVPSVIFRLAGGRIAEGWCCADFLTFLWQLGVLAAAGEPGGSGEHRKPHSPERAPAELTLPTAAGLPAKAPRLGCSRVLGTPSKSDDLFVETRLSVPRDRPGDLWQCPLPLAVDNAALATYFP